MRYSLKAILTLPLTMASAIGGICPPAGPVLPPPAVPDNFSLPSVVSVIDDLLASPPTGVDWNTTSFSIEVTSDVKTFFQYHYTAPVRNETGVSVIDTDTVYRVASVTKVFTVLALLIHAQDKLEDPITWHVPEISDHAVYQEISLRMLASQIAGVPREGETC
jgi:CubicO group peptidase (beta-lactamase class C family)